LPAKENIPVHNINRGALHDFSGWGHRMGTAAPEVPHRHSYYEVILFFEGGGTDAIDFVNYPIYPCAVHFVKPGQVHMMGRAERSSGCNFRFMREYFYENETGAASFFREYPFFSPQAEMPVLQVAEPEFAVLRKLVQVYAESAAYAPADASRSLVRAMLQLLKPAFEQAVLVPHTPNHLSRFMMLVAQNFNEKRNVADYSEMLHITPNYLNELCTGHLGITAKALIEEQVMLEIKRLLFHTDLSVKEIAFRLNFDDPSYFVRRFKEKTGYTPAAFRTESRR